MNEQEEKTTTIRDLNDRFRKGAPDGTDITGRVMLTSGIQALCNTDAEPNKHQPKLFETIRSFDDFTSDVESRWSALSHC